MNFPAMLCSLVANGCLYGCLAMGYTLIYHLCGIFNYAHGDLLMLGGYLGLVFCRLGLSLLPAMLLSALFCACLSFLFHRLVYAPLQGASSMEVLLAGMGLSFLLQGICQWVFGSAPLAYPASVLSAKIALFSAQLPLVTGLILLLSPLLVLLLTLLYAKHPFFLRMRAAAEEPLGAETVFVSSKACRDMAFLLGGALAGMAGVAFGCKVYLLPTSGATLGLKAFGGAVLGGSGSPFAAFCGAMALALAEGLLSLFLETPFLDAILALLLFALLFLPRKKTLVR